MANTSSGLFTLEEFYNRGVIKLAPDALVYVGGSLKMRVIAPVCNNDDTLSFNDGITAITVQNNVDPPGSSSATIEVNTPIYGEKSKYWVLYEGMDKTVPVRAPLFVPMTEVKIYFKGRFLVEGKPRYYPAFWGLITTVEENYSGGLYKITLNCVDMLHWWAYSTINVHPVPASNIMAGGGQKLTVWSTIFDTQNPYQIIYAMAKGMGMHEFVTVAWPAQKTPLQTIYPTKLFEKVTAGIMSYWQQRLPNPASLLRMYGLGGARVDKNGFQVISPEFTKTTNKKDSESQEAAVSKDDEQFKLDIDYIRKFQTFADYQNMGKFDNAEFMTKLEIATTIKSRIDFEFYQDVDGAFVFKPPFFNLNVKGVLPYTLLNNEIQSYSVSTQTEGIITVLTVKTPMHPRLKITPFDLGVGFHMDLDLAKQYGIRHREIMMEYVTNADMARSLALGQMSSINYKTLGGSVTIPGRPEMRLGFPVYMEHRDTFHSVKSINHSFDYGGTFTTTLSLEGERRKLFGPPKGQDFSNSSFDTWVPLKDKVFRLNKKKKDEEEKKGKAKKNQPPQIFSRDVVDKKSQELLAGQQRMISMEQGRYDVSDRTLAYKDPKNHALEVTATTTTVPYTDEDGYQLVGSFPYGRNVNPIAVLSNQTNIPVLKEVWLTTMARPIYTSESNAMEILFFDDKEGSVPGYLNTGQNPMPEKLGIEVPDIDVDDKQLLETTQTSSQNKNSNVKNAKEKPVITPDISEETTFMKIADNVIPPALQLITKNLSGKKLEGRT